MLDILIRGAEVFDGLGNPGLKIDVGIQGDKVVALGTQVHPRLSLSAKETIEAQGLALMPGIVDNHTHYDAQVTWDSACSPSPQMGVTTAVIGNCGFTIAPCRPEHRDVIMRNLTQVEGMSIDVLRAGIDWKFETIAEYFDFVEQSGSLMNLAGFVGHSSVRTYVMGDQASSREATSEEVAQMKSLVVDGLKAGAIGFATSTSPAHNGEGGVPMPSRLASDDELRTLVSTLGEAGKGVFMLTKGGHTKIDFLASLSEQNSRPVVVAALLHNSTNPGVVFDDLDRIEAAQQRGLRIHGAISPCPLTNDFTLRSPYPVEGLAAWRPALSLKGEALKTKLGEQSFRDAVRAEVATPATFRIFNGEWSKVNVVETKRSENAHYEHQNIASLAAKVGQDPLDFMLDLAISEDLETVFSAVLLNSDEEAVGRMLQHPASLVSLSDAGAHLTFFNDAGFGLHLLGHWCRQLGVLSLAQAISKLTSEPAKIFGIKQRGLIKEGAFADLMLFDPLTVNRGPKYRAKDLPAGGSRLLTPGIGVRGVWVNGQRIVGENGDLTESAQNKLVKPGKFLREFA